MIQFFPIINILEKEPVSRSETIIQKNYGIQLISQRKYLQTGKIGIA